MVLLGDFVEPEDIDNENKAYHLYPEAVADLNESEVYRLVRDGRWNTNFEKIVDENLMKFISHLVPKYASCFGNAGINGCLNIGVDDTCEISGCPYKGEFPIDQLHETVEKSLEENVRGGLSGMELLERVDITLIPLETNTDLLVDDAGTAYKKATEEMMKYYDLLDIYGREYSEFHLKHREYTQGLEVLLNTRRYRMEMVDFIRKSYEKSENQKNMESLIEQLESPDYLKLDLDDLEWQREDRSTLFYWVVRFRTECKDGVCETKPCRPQKPSIYGPRQILCHLPSLRRRSIENNSDLKYCLIRIHFRFADYQTDSLNPIEFQERYSGRWVSRTRYQGYSVAIKLNKKKSIHQLRSNGPYCL